jgi:hypothetical protein
VWSGHQGKEIWAKPLGKGRVAAVVFNRNGTTSQCNVPDANIRNSTGSAICPCDDDTTAPGYSGVQDISLPFDTIPSKWLAPAAAGPLSCSVRDVFSGATGKTGKDLGKFSGAWLAAKVPPHGSRFVILSGCARQTQGVLKNDDDGVKIAAVKTGEEPCSAPAPLATDAPNILTIGDSILMCGFG